MAGRGWVVIFIFFTRQHSTPNHCKKLLVLLLVLEQEGLQRGVVALQHDDLQNFSIDLIECNICVSIMYIWT
jgi:hypothetical protein